MPSRNVLKVDSAETFYHVYARGASKTKIFLHTEDYVFFLQLFARYVSPKPQVDKGGEAYPHLYSRLELVCYCLMTNHFHLLIYQKDMGVMSQLMRGVLVSYSRYFNKKYQRSGPLFETRYKASPVYTQSYLEHITRYIHLNPARWRNYAYSSLPMYLGKTEAAWLCPDKILNLFKDSREYLTFLEDYEDNKRMLDELKHELANTL